MRYSDDFVANEYICRNEWNRNLSAFWPSQEKLIFAKLSWLEQQGLKLLAGMGKRLAAGECLPLSVDIHLNLLNNSYDRMYR